MPKLPPSIAKSAESYGITFPAQLPIYHSPPDYKHLNEWADSQVSFQLRDLARKFVDNLRYISFEEFLAGLKQTIADFKEKNKDEPYVLLMAEKRGDRLEKGCSDQWVIALALELCGLPPPVSIVNTKEFIQFIDAHPNVKNILMLDDAAYSGTQKSLAIDHFIEKMVDNNKKDLLKQLTFYIGIPFLSEDAKVSFKNHVTEYGNDDRLEHIFANTITLQHNVMPCMKDFLTEGELSYATTLNIPLVRAHKILTYFDHKLPDFMSFFQCIYTGEPLFSEKSSVDLPFRYERFFGVTKPSKSNDSLGYNIKKIIPPYRLKNPEDLKELESDIKNGLVGTRSQYPITDPKIKSIVLNTIPKKPIFTGYEKLIIPFQAQINFDTTVFNFIQDRKIKEQKPKTQTKPKSSWFGWW